MFNIHVLLLLYFLVDVLIIYVFPYDRPFYFCASICILYKYIFVSHCICAFKFMPCLLAFTYVCLLMFVMILIRCFFFVFVLLLRLVFFLIWMHLHKFRICVCKTAGNIPLMWQEFLNCFYVLLRLMSWTFGSWGGSLPFHLRFPRLCLRHVLFHLAPGLCTGFRLYILNHLHISNYRGYSTHSICFIGDVSFSSTHLQWVHRVLVLKLCRIPVFFASSRTVYTVYNDVCDTDDRGSRGSRQRGTPVASTPLSKHRPVFLFERHLLTHPPLHRGNG